LDVPIVASDHDPEAIETARRNARRAGVEDVMTFATRDARELEGATAPGWIVSDPPYGDRLAAKPLQLAGFFRQFGDALLRFRGYDVALLSGNALFSKSLAVPCIREHTLFNGAIECRMYWYKIPA
jgi:23S rRNA G2445 N2-methylase RlmL